MTEITVQNCPYCGTPPAEGSDGRLRCCGLLCPIKEAGESYSLVEWNFLQAPWIDVDERLPDGDLSGQYRKYYCWVRVGSMSVTEGPEIVLGRQRGGLFRFVSGDWRTVLRWMPCPDVFLK